MEAPSAQTVCWRYCQRRFGALETVTHCAPRRSVTSCGLPLYGWVAAVSICFLVAITQLTAYIKEGRNFTNGLPSYYNPTVSELFRMSHYFTSVCKDRLRGWVLHSPGFTNNTSGPTLSCDVLDVVNAFSVTGYLGKTGRWCCCCSSCSSCCSSSCSCCSWCSCSCCSCV